MPTPAQDDEALHRICEEVAEEIDASPFERLCFRAAEDFAKAVARRYAATVGVGVPEEVRKAFEGVDTGPLAYRPQELDDWGVIRQTREVEGGWHPVVASVRVRDDEAEQNAARREDRDPRSTGAIGSAIVASFNWAMSVAAPDRGRDAPPSA